MSPPLEASPRRLTCVTLSQILYLISAFGVLSETGHAVLDSGLVFVSVRCVPSFYKFSWVLKYTDLTQGLYPTLIVILVSTQMSPVEYHSTHSTGMQFTRDQALVQAPSMPQHVCRIGREYVSDSDTQVSSVVFMNISDEEKSPSVG